MLCLSSHMYIYRQGLIVPIGGSHHTEFIVEERLVSLPFCILVAILHLSVDSTQYEWVLCPSVFMPAETLGVVPRTRLSLNMPLSFQSFHVSFFESFSLCCHNISTHNLYVCISVINKHVQNAATTTLRKQHWNQR